MECSDDETREQLELDGLEAARAWRCPRVGCSPGDLDGEHREALRAIGSVTGHRFEVQTCPLSSVWASWVHRVVDAEEHGLADDRAAYGPPPRALVQAVSVLRHHKRRRDAEEARVAREERKR
jgi:hypothetical protein